jgi:hypothetical protein
MRGRSRRTLSIQHSAISIQPKNIAADQEEWPRIARMNTNQNISTQQSAFSQAIGDQQLANVKTLSPQRSRRTQRKEDCTAEYAQSAEKHQEHLYLS